MADKTVTTTVPPKRHRFLRGLVWVFGILIILVVVVYFVATSSAFLKGAILPRVSKSLNADVTVSSASISPFKEVVLHDLKVQAAGQTPVLTAPEVRLRYSLMDIIRGHINVDDILVASPVISVVENPDGSKNYDAIVKAQTKSSEKKGEPEKSGKPSQPPQIFLKKVAVTEGTLRYVKNYNDKNRDTSEITHFNFSLDNLKNGDTAKITLAGEAAVNNNPPSPGTNGLLQAKLSGDFALAFGPDLKPGSIQGGTRMEVLKAEGALADLEALVADLKCDVSPTEIKQVALKFSKGTTELGQLLASGPFDMSKTEGKIAIQVLSIDKQVLNLAGAKSGLDFGSTVINSTNQIELSKSGKLIVAVGGVNIGKMQVTQKGKTTPTLDLAAAYDLTVDTAASNAVIRVLILDGKQNGSQIIKTELSAPMTLGWGNAQSQVGDSTLTVAVNNLNLADWKAFAGDAVSSGKVNAQVKLVSQQSGNLLNFNVDTHLTDLSLKAGTNEISQANVTLQVDGRANNLTNITMNTYQVQLARGNQQLAQISGTGTYDTKAGSADLQTSIQASIPALLTLSPQSDMKFSSGKVDMKVHVVQRTDKVSGAVQAITGDLTLSELTGTMGSNNFQNFASTMKLDIGKTEQELQIRRVTGSLSENDKPGGSFDISGTLNTNKNTQITAKLSDFNQNALRPFLEPLLTDKKLTSVAINGSASVQSTDGNSAIKANVTVANLVVTDTKTQTAAGTPLQATIAVDVASSKNVADVKQLQLTLTPTDRAKNELNMSGHLDLTQTNATQGNLKVASEALDLTKYYDLFAADKPAADKKAAAKKGSTAPSDPNQPVATAPGEPEKEPEGKPLPFKNFTTVVDLKHIYLRETEIANLQTTVLIDGGHVLLKPFQMSLNGAPVTATADLDLAVPGYKYDVSFGAQAIPLTPLVNSFAPERKGQIGGTLTAAANLTGAGTTGVNLKKNLNGKFDVTSTNLNLSIVNIKSRMLKSLINVVASIPELLSNPTAGALSALQGATGIGGGGLTEELKKAPIDSIIVHGVAGSGNVNLQQAVVSSSAFKAEAKGTVAIAEVLTNSTIQIPVTISLSHALAQKVNLVPSGTPTNAAYAALPDFYTMKGTVGNPKNDINKTALLKLTATALTGNLNLGGKSGSVLQGLNGVLGNSSSGNTSPNASSSTSKSGSVLKGLGGLLNSGSSNTNAATNDNKQSPAGNLLNGLFGPKKK
jgi:uncharacterized protein involved in outer membrane biogenesis